MELSFIVVIRYQCTGQTLRRMAHDCDKRNKTYLIPPRLNEAISRTHAPAGGKTMTAAQQHLVGQ